MQTLTSKYNRNKRDSWSLLLRSAAIATLLISLGIGSAMSQEKTQQMTYATPQDAVQAMISAVKTQDNSKLMQVFGPQMQEIVNSGDDVADKRTREDFLQKYDQMNRLRMDSNDSATLYVGAENWPFPIPLVKKNGLWSFDTAAGKKEILYRRIGRNELSTVDTLHSLVDAQKEYASQPRDNDTVKQYAQKLLSDEGKHNGLYWKTDKSEATSPIGPLIAQAASEGYRRKSGAIPFHGYVYRLIESQGSSAPGGTMNYMTNGKLTRGFAIVAYPVEYRNSGVMTFIVNQEGKIYQKDLGANTERIAASISSYNPDRSWRFVE